MELKVKFIKWSAGIPVVILNKHSAEKIGVEVNDRVLIKTLSKNPSQMHVIVDISTDLIKPQEIAISEEVQNQMNLRKHQKIDVILSAPPKSLGLIKKKLNNHELEVKEINQIIKDIVDNSISEAEIALFVSAMYRNGMTFKETTALIRAILKTGETFNLRRKYVVDKHCIGGVPGNRTTPIVVSICAATGLTIPKNSSRAITSPAGTADVIEAIAKVDFSLKELEKIILKTNGCMVWGGGLKVVPADAKIIHVEKMLEIDPQAQLLASIMSKKLSVGSDFILIDIPYGKTAKISDMKKALDLKKKFETLGKYFKKKLKVVITDGSQPIGNGIGPILELIDLISILDRKKQGPKDLEEKGIFLATQLLKLSGKYEKRECEQIARETLYSGKAFEKFKEIIKAQKGNVKDFDELKPGKWKKTFYCKRSCRVVEIDNKEITQLARVAGCPEDKKSGIYLYCKKGKVLEKKQPILTIYAETWSRLRAAVNYYKENNPIKFK